MHKHCSDFLKCMLIEIYKVLQVRYVNRYALIYLHFFYNIIYFNWRPYTLVTNQIIF
jgi:hypothetical protein